MKHFLIWLFDGLFVRLTNHMGRAGFILYGGGSGGGGSTTATQYTSNIPEYASGSFMNLVGKSEALSNTPYQPYTAQRIEGFTPMQQQSFDRAQGLGNTSFTNPNTASAYMSPFMQNVVDIQKREAMRDANIATTQRNAQAVKAGAFGGSRQAIMDAEAQRNLQTNLSDIQGRGLQQSFDQAQRQFNTEFGQQADVTGMINQLGGQQQQLGQRQLDQQYSDFQAQRDYPYQQLGFLSDILRGVSGSTRTMYTSQPQASGLQTLAGLGTAAAGLGRMFAEGGEVMGYAGGGITGLLPDAQLAQQSQKPGMMGLAAQDEMGERAALRGAMPQGAPMPDAGEEEPVFTKDDLLVLLQDALAQGDDERAAAISEVLDELDAEADAPETGIASVVPETMDFADGGIVGYELPELQRDPRIAALVAGRGETDAEEDMKPLPAFFRSLMQGKTVDQVRADRNAGLPAVAPQPEAEKMPSDRAIMVSEDSKRRSSQQNAPAGIAALAPAAPAAPAARTGAGSGIGEGTSASVRSERSTSRTGAPAKGLDLGADKAMAENERARMEELGLEKAALDEQQAAMEQRFKDAGLAGEAKEKRLKGQESQLDAKKEDAKSFALIQAGLSILSADPSRGAFSAIGEGALKGLSAYKGDTKELEAQRDKINSEMDEILDLRRQESMAQGKERDELKARRSTLELAAKKDIRQFNSTTGLNLKTKEQELLFQAKLKEREMENALEAARISASGRAGRGMVNGVPRDVMVEFGKAQQRVTARLKEDPRFMYQRDPAKKDAMLRQETLREISNNPYLMEYSDVLIGGPATQAPAIDTSGFKVTRE
jgi:hypothetical protein